MKKTTIPLLIILFALAMASRKQFDLDPYTTFVYMPYAYIATSQENHYEKIHPLYSEKSYVPPAIKLVPPKLLFNGWFHIVSSTAFWALTIGGIFVLIRMGGFSNYQAMAIALFSLFVGNLVIRELLGIILSGPSPFVGYTHYSIRSPVIPLSIFGLIFMFKRRFALGGILIGLATFFHLKFGFRFFSLIFLTLLIWKYWGLQRVGLQQKDITWGNIVALTISWGFFFVIAYFQIQSSMYFYESLELPKSKPIIDQFAWLLQNEPDDYLFSYYFPSDRSFFGFISLFIATVIFSEITIKHSHSNKLKKFAFIWEIATLGAMFFWCIGFLFDSFLIDRLPLKLAYSLAMIRFWDLTWVVILGFWVTLFAAVSVVTREPVFRLGKFGPIASNFFFHQLMILFICANLVIFIKNKDGEIFTVSGLGSGRIPYLNTMDYVQICDEKTPDYNKAYREALTAIQSEDDKEFEEALIPLNTIYNEIKIKLENPPTQNPDVSHLRRIKYFKNGHFSKSIKGTTESEKTVSNAPSTKTIIVWIVPKHVGYGKSLKPSRLLRRLVWGAWIGLRAFEP